MYFLFLVRGLYFKISRLFRLKFNFYFNSLIKKSIAEYIVHCLENLTIPLRRATMLITNIILKTALPTTVPIPISTSLNFFLDKKLI